MSERSEEPEEVGAGPVGGEPATGTEPAGPADSQPTGTEATATETEERHASWIELFFDLVVVAGIGQLAHLLHGNPSIGNVGTYVLLFFAFWVAWACFTMYGNIAGDSARTGTMLLGMFGMSVMTASVPGIHSGHANAFALAYIFARFIAGRVWQRGQVVVDWPIAQIATGTIPWIVSLWMDEPTKYWLWALGLALDMMAMFTFSGQRLLGRTQERFDRVLEKRSDAGRRPPEGLAQRLPKIQAAYSDPAHLTERLGLFIIIVLGEGVIQVIENASEVTWDGPLVQLAIASFVLLIGVWSLSLLYGHAGVPHLSPTGLPIRISMALHCFTACAVAALAAGLGAAVEHAHDTIPSGALWLICASTAAYFGISAIAGVTTRAGWRWLCGWAIPCTVLPIALAVFGGRLATLTVVWAVVIVVCWQVLYERRRVRGKPRRKAPSDGGTATA